VPLSTSRVEICVIKPKPVNKIEAQRIPEPVINEFVTIENLKDIKIIKESIHDATIPCNDLNSIFNSFLIMTIIGFI
jgi:hypothetical protein